MGTDLATFAKKLREDGIESARAEGAKILAEAEKKAQNIIAQAQAKALELEKQNQDKMARDKKRAEDEIKLIFRDLMKAFHKSIESAGTRLLKTQIGKAINEKEILKGIIELLLKAHSSGTAIEIAPGGEKAQDLGKLVISLLKDKGVTGILVEEIEKTGFEARISGSNEVFEITDESIAQSLKELLSGELKKYLSE